MSVCYPKKENSPMFSSPHKIIRKHFPKITRREVFRVTWCIFHLPFQKLPPLPQNEVDFNSNCKWSIVAN